MGGLNEVGAPANGIVFASGETPGRPGMTDLTPVLGPEITPTTPASVSHLQPPVEVAAYHLVPRAPRLAWPREVVATPLVAHRL